MYKNLPPFEAIMNLAVDGRAYDGEHHKNFFFIEILKHLREIKEVENVELKFDEGTTVGIQIDEWRDLIGWDEDNEIPP